MQSNCQFLWKHIDGIFKGRGMTMKKIIIVEDDLGRGLSLADQFDELSINHPDLEIEVGSVCYFNSRKEKAQEKIAEYNVGERNIEIVSLWNFYEVMEEYYNNEIDQYIFIIDFLLDDDGSLGIPKRRVNIRYAQTKHNDGKIWFYTSAGGTTEIVLKDLITSYVLDVAEVKGDYIRLHLEDNDEFMNCLHADNE